MLFFNGEHLIERVKNIRSILTAFELKRNQNLPFMKHTVTDVVKQTTKLVKLSTTKCAKRRSYFNK